MSRDVLEKKKKQSFKGLWRLSYGPFLRRPSWQMADLFCLCSLPCWEQREQTLAAPSFLPDSLCSLALPFLPSVDGRVLSPLHPVSLAVCRHQLPHPIFPSDLGGYK